jgi:hypothetical protein
MSIQTGNDPFNIQLIFGTSVDENRDLTRKEDNQSRITINFTDLNSSPSFSDETLEALSDAQIVAPAVLTADLHSADHRNSFLYVFDYQTKFGDYPQVQFLSIFFLFSPHI